MVEKISAVTLRVANMEASVRFYKDVLGLEIIYGNGVITSRAIMNLTFQLARLLPDYDLFADSVLVAHLGRRKDASGKSRT